MHFTLHAFYTTLSITNDHRMDIPLVGSYLKAGFLITCRYSPDPWDTGIEFYSLLSAIRT